MGDEDLICFNNFLSSGLTIGIGLDKMQQRGDDDE